MSNIANFCLINVRVVCVKNETTLYSCKYCDYIHYEEITVRKHEQDWHLSQIIRDAIADALSSGELAEKAAMSLFMSKDVEDMINMDGGRVVNSGENVQTIGVIEWEEDYE